MRSTFAYLGDTGTPEDSGWTFFLDATRGETAVGARGGKGFHWSVQGEQFRQYFRGGIRLLNLRKERSRPKLGGHAIAGDVRLPRTADFSLKSSNLEGLPPILVRYWPAYTNPYQALFYGFPSDQFLARPGDGNSALSDIAHDSKRLVCFHVHWLNYLFKEAIVGANGSSAFDDFLKTCRLIREKRGIVAWTIHNLVEHESPDPEFETGFRRKLAQIADVVIVHGQSARTAAIERFGVLADRIIDIPHGSYIGVYDDMMASEDARSRVRAPDRQTIFANVGAMRPYKGLDHLVTAFLDLEREGASIGLLLAGSASKANTLALTKLFRASEAIHFNIGRVSDDELQHYLNASDFMVLPYRAILTSGSAILALSFGRPVIAPEIGGLAELIEDGVNGFLYDPLAPNGLKDAMARATATDSTVRSRMSKAAFARATTLRWSEGRSRFIEAISQSWAGRHTP